MNIILLRGVIAMNIIAEADNRISIELTKDDMERLGITYEALDYSTAETRRILWTLLDEAGHRLGRKFSLTEKMLIEAVPGGGGGCMLYITVTDRGSECQKGSGSIFTVHETVCQSDEIDTISALSRALYGADCVLRSELYTNGSAYRLLLHGKPHNTEKIRAIAEEYCIICSPVAAASTAEHWKRLASPDAVGILAALC